jgi:cobalt-zinc-cadmium efflux system protein
MHKHSHHSHAIRDGHNHARSRDRTRLLLTLALVAGYMTAEAIGGWLANSLALLADAGHMLSDAAALALSLFALWIAQRPPDALRTYGYYRAEILAALVNGSSLVAVALLIFVEAARRAAQPPEVQGPLMTWIALGGLAVNLLALGVLHGSHTSSLNVRAAWLHVLSDALGSVAALTSGALVWAYGWRWADPAASVLIALLVIRSAWGLVKESVAVLMESTPHHLDADQVRAALRESAGVRGVHDLHIWAITSGLVALSAHVVIDDLRGQQELLQQLRLLLRERFGIDHVTLQLETPEVYQPALPPRTGALEPDAPG